jgi:hypothetical protein
VDGRIVVVLLVSVVFIVMHLRRYRGPGPWSGWFAVIPVYVSKPDRKKLRRIQEKMEAQETFEWLVWFFMISILTTALMTHF